MMKRIAAIVLAACLAAPAPAAEDEEMRDGVDLLEEGARIILRGLMEEMGTALEDLDAMAEEMGPLMLELREMIGDMTLYHMPEVLPNGDIIIRRKVPLEVEPPGEGGEIEI